MSDQHTDYMKKLHEWQKACNFHYAMCWNYYGMQFMQTNQSRLYSPAANPAAGVSGQNRMYSNNVHQQQQQSPLSQRTEYKTAPLFQRVLAEFVDFLVLMGVKLLGIMLLLHFTGLTTEDMTFKIFLTEEMMEDNISAEDLQYMLIMAFLYRMLACLYEALFVSLHGSTPGKRIFRLEIITCQACFPVQRGGEQLVSVYPATRPNLASAWVRSIIKNFSIAFLMPAFLTAFFYQHKRTSYDIVANTIVVQR